MVPVRAYDVVVVGAGAAGCVVAARLAESGDRSILLVEAGPDETNAVPAAWRNGWRLPTVPDWGFTSEPDAAGKTGALRRGRLLGGTSWLTRFAVRGGAADFDAWAARGCPGWSYVDVLPAFRHLERDAEFGREPWHGDRGPLPITRYPELAPSAIHAAALLGLDAMGIPAVEDHNAPDAIGVGRMPMSSRHGTRVTAADAYLAEEARPSALTILPDTHVANVQLKAGRACGVSLADGAQIRADLVVLAAGTYGSPTILMRSGIGPAAHLRSLGIDVLVDLPGVGENLADHPAASLDVGSVGSMTEGPALHSIATWRSRAAGDAGPADLMLWFTDPTDDDPVFWIDVVLLKSVSRGSVRLRSTDASAPPRITLPDAHEAGDLDRLIEGYRLASELSDRSPVRTHVARASSPTPPGRDGARRRVLENLYSIPHVVGTCAMGPRPGDGAVVDHVGRVHGVERLHVIDASIIPDAPSGFPHVITLMLAEHLSERLRAT